MARFYGKIGYSEPKEVRPGVYEDVIVEQEYYGDVLRNARRLTDGEHLNRDITVNNSVSIVADAFAYQHFHEIKYVLWMGVTWSVVEAEVLRPRINLRLGGVYNGPTAPAPDNP